jgi:hypothetical protein
MKFTLKDYQTEAVDAVLANLRKARKRWRDERELQAFSLSATTGAGKTVMAANVFEALFHGDDNFNFERDPSALVVWFSDDPSLNEQTRFRLQEASDRLLTSDLVVVQHPFNREKLEAGKVYFLNTQKLSKTSHLVRGQDPDEEARRLNSVFESMRPDMTLFTIWDTIRNTIEDPALTLYLVLDEAHRGLGSPTQAEINSRTTIVQRLINGAGGVPPVPVVLGVSATVERFNVAMEGADGRTKLSNVVVESAKVQASGLLKDTIVLEMPKEAGPFDTVLLRRATRAAVSSTAEWAKYALAQEDTELVLPLLVVQVPNVPDQEEVALSIRAILDEWPEISVDSIAHVFGDHTTQRFGPYEIPHVLPERVHDSTWVRVLLAKDAINTGWDCPRAEVMVSFRAAQDRTYITQLIGRMVRTPLARRIPGNQALNSVTCILPFFNQAEAERVVKALESGGDSGVDVLSGRRVLINPETVHTNPAIPQHVLDAFLTLPSHVLPRKGAKPIKRLTALAHELAADGLLDDAGKLAHSHLHSFLQDLMARFSDKVSTARASIETVVGVSLTANFLVGEQGLLPFEESADLATIDDYYRRASRIVSPDLARTFVEALAEDVSSADSPEDALEDAHLQFAALGLLPDLQAQLEAQADRLAKEWFGQFGLDIRLLSDERQDVYRQLKAWSRESEAVPLAKPISDVVPTRERQDDDSERPLPRYDLHLLAAEDGKYPAKLNGLESSVVGTELSREGILAWYRNPAFYSQESLGIPYAQGGETKILRPDFLFFGRGDRGSVLPHIIDPHSAHLSDALPKIVGLAAYAQANRDLLGRVESVCEIDDRLLVLDLTQEPVRIAARAATDPRQLFLQHGAPYSV